MIRKKGSYHYEATHYPDENRYRFFILRNVYIGVTVRITNRHDCTVVGGAPNLTVGVCNAIKMRVTTQRVLILSGHSDRWMSMCMAHIVPPHPNDYYGMWWQER